MTELLVTYLGDPTLKDRFLHEIGQHEAADMLLKGTYGEGSGCQWKGCAIGCSLRSLNKIQGKTDGAENEQTGVHDRYPVELGLPLWLAYMEDHIFESLPSELSKTWPRRLAEAIPVGAVVDDLVLAKILRWQLGADTYGVRHAATDPAVVAVVDRMVTLFDREISGDSPTTADWDEAAWAALAAWAARAAWDARDARAAWAARAARAAWDARAARDAWDAWAARAARAAWDAWDARAAWAARAARDARAAWDARAARAAWAARAARDARAAWDGFYPALSEYILGLLRELQVREPVA